MDFQEKNKQNIIKWEGTLNFLIQELNKNDIKYYLSASGLKYILGEKVYPYDIDLFMSARDVKRAFKILNKYSVNNLRLWKDKYWEFQGTYFGIPFEICEWAKETTIVIHKFKSMEIPIDKEC
jgi:hypothetical protein